MSMLGNDFRKRAEENNKEAVKLFGSQEFETSRKVQASAVIAKVTANMLSVLGELVDYLRGEGEVDASTARRNAQADRFDALRKAFVAGGSSGDYTNYDRLVAEFGESLAGSQENGEGGS